MTIAWLKRTESITKQVVPAINTWAIHMDDESKDMWCFRVDCWALMEVYTQEDTQTHQYVYPVSRVVGMYYDFYNYGPYLTSSDEDESFRFYVEGKTEEDAIREAKKIAKICGYHEDGASPCV